MERREIPESGAKHQLRALLSHRRERLVNRLCRDNLATEQADEMVEEVDRLDSALARLEDPSTPCCLRCGETISLTRRTLAPDSPLCTACAVVAEGAPRDGRVGPTSTWDARFLPELGQ